MAPRVLQAVFLLGLMGCATTRDSGGGGGAPSVSRGFEELDGLLNKEVSEIEVGAQRLKTPLMRAYREQLTDRVVPALRRLVQEAHAEAERARSEREDITRRQCTRRAGRGYERALLATQALTLEVNLALAGDAGYAQGQPGFDVANRLQAYHASIEPLLEAVFRDDFEQLTASLPAASQSYQPWLDVLYRWQASVKTGAKVSKAALLAADTVLVVLTLGAGGGSLGRGTGSVALAASGEATLAPLDAAAAREIAEAIRRLIVSGAMDGAIVGGLLHAEDRGWANDDTSQKESFVPSAESPKTSLGKVIAEGHAFEKHVLEGGEFKSFGINTREEFARFIDRIVAEAKGTNVRPLSGGRTAYWDEATDTVVIRNPSAADGGTAFRPTLGKRYFVEILK